jgi:hypothetical protein
VTHGWSYSHIFWVCNRDNFALRPEFVSDWIKPYPELLVLEAVCICDFGRMIRDGFVQCVTLLAHTTGLADWMCLDSGKIFTFVVYWTAPLSRFLTKHYTHAVNSLHHRPSFFLFPSFGAASQNAKPPPQSHSEA